MFGRMVASVALLILATGETARAATAVVLRAQCEVLTQSATLSADRILLPSDPAAGRCLAYFDGILDAAYAANGLGFRVLGICVPSNGNTLTFVRAFLDGTQGAALDAQASSRSVVLGVLKRAYPCREEF